MTIYKHTKANYLRLTNIIVTVNILLAMLPFAHTCAQGNSIFKHIGKYTWVKKAVINNPEQIPYRKFESKVEREIIPKKKNLIFKRKMSLNKSVLKGKFTMPKELPLILKGKPILPDQKILAPEFLFKDNALFNITYIDKAHGFLSDAAMSVAEDDKHNIWIGTEDAGLIKYDGLYYYVYNKKSGFISNKVGDLKYQPSLGLWVSTGDGIVVIKKDSLFEPSFPLIKNGDLRVRTISDDSHQNIWINTNGKGAYKVNAKTLTLQHFDTTCGLPENSFNQVLTDKQDNIWFINADILKVEGSTISRFFTNKIAGHEEGFLKMLEDADTMWVGTFSRSLLKITPTDTIQISTNKDFVSRTFDLIKSKGALWYNLYGSGACCLQGDHYIIFDKTNGLCDNGTFRLLQDSYNNIWITTAFGGISRLNDLAVIPDTDMPPFLRSAICIKTDLQGNRWYFINGGKIVKETTDHYELITNEAKPPLYSGRWFYDGAFNADGSVWLTAYNQGIALYSKNKFSFYQFTDDPLGLVLLDVENGQHHTLWASTEKYGLVFFRGNKLYHLSATDGLLTNKSAQLESDRNGALICLNEKGIQKISNDSIYDLHINNTLFSFSGTGFYTTATGEYLIGTADKGLLQMDENSLYSINKVGDVSFNSISTILQDKKGITWLTNPNGIIRCRKQGLTVSGVKSFDGNNGLLLGKISGGAYIDNGGIPHWAVSNGFLTYKPEFEVSTVTPPSNSVLNITINGNPVGLKDEITIYPNDELQLFYNIIFWGYEKQLKQKYALIKINSKDTTEFSIGDKGMIKLQDLFADEYKICIVANSFGTKVYSNAIHLVVRPYWYNTRWFFALCSICILALVILFFRYRTKRLQRSKQALERTVSNRTAQLKTSLEDREMLLKEIHHRVKNNLQVISGLLELQKEEITDDKIKAALSEGQSRVRSVALIHQNLYQHENLSTIQFKQFIPDLVKHLAEIFEEKSKPITVEVKGEDAQLDIDTAVPLGLIINELLTNAYKYVHPQNESARVVLDLRTTVTGTYQLMYRDNGPGITGDINFETATSLGLRLIKGLIGQLAGTVSYQYDHESIFTFIFKDGEARKKE